MIKDKSPMYNLLNFCIYVYIYVTVTQVNVQNIFNTQKVPLGLFPVNTLALEVIIILTLITKEKWMTNN